MGVPLEIRNKGEQEGTPGNTPKYLNFSCKTDGNCFNNQLKFAKKPLNGQNPHL